MRLHSLASVGVLATAAALVSACGGNGSSQSSSSTSSGTGGMSAPFVPAEHAAAPQVAKGPGNVLSSPHFVPVFFAGDDAKLQGQLDDFLGKLGSSAYWKAATSEYGVGAATAGAAVVLTETAAASLDSTTIPTWLAGKLDGKDPLWPQPTANTVYVLHYPAGTTITQTSQFQGTLSSCTDFGGYHDTAPLASGGQTAFAVIPRCTAFGPLMGIDALTGAESHELVEASTDPAPTQTMAAFGQVDDADLFWELALGGGEVGDMCAQNPGAFVKDAALGYTVQRIWSNKSAAASHDPCVPVPTGEVYFNAVPAITGTVSLGGAGGLDLNGVTIPVGQTKTVEVDLFSDAATHGPFTVEALDFASVAMMQPEELTFSWDKTSGQNGDKLQLSITAKTAGQLGGSIFILTSKLGSQTNLWVGFVGN